MLLRKDLHPIIFNNRRYDLNKLIINDGYVIDIKGYKEYCNKEVKSVTIFVDEDSLCKIELDFNENNDIIVKENVKECRILLLFHDSSGFVLYDKYEKSFYNKYKGLMILILIMLFSNLILYYMIVEKGILEVS